jgi:hypothetical protein
MTTTLHIEQFASTTSPWKALDRIDARDRAGVLSAWIAPVDDAHYVVVDLDFADAERATAFLLPDRRLEQMPDVVCSPATSTRIEPARERPTARGATAPASPGEWALGSCAVRGPPGSSTPAFRQPLRRPTAAAPGSG